LAGILGRRKHRPYKGTVSSDWVGVGFHTDALSPMWISLRRTSVVDEDLADKTARQESATTFPFASVHSS